MPSARQPTSDALGCGLVGEGTYPDPVIWAFGALARGHVRLGEPILHLVQHRLCVVLLFKGPYLDLIDEWLLRALFLLGQLLP